MSGMGYCEDCDQVVGTGHLEGCQRETIQSLKLQLAASEKKREEAEADAQGYCERAELAESKLHAVAVECEELRKALELARPLMEASQRQVIGEVKVDCSDFFEALEKALAKTEEEGKSELSSDPHNPSKK